MALIPNNDTGHNDLTHYLLRHSLSTVLLSWGAAALKLLN